MPLNRINVILSGECVRSERLLKKRIRSEIIETYNSDPKEYTANSLSSRDFSSEVDNIIFPEAFYNELSQDKINLDLVDPTILTMEPQDFEKYFKSLRFFDIYDKACPIFSGIYSFHAICCSDMPNSSILSSITSLDCKLVVETKYNKDIHFVLWSCSADHRNLLLNYKSKNNFIFEQRDINL